jgi:hypothetical protein
MEIFSVNLAGKVRRETLNGRSFLVAPMSLLPLNGVLHGSQGPLFYPERETRNTYKAWDYMPLVVWHPTDSQGRHVSARDPGIIQNWGIGFNRKTHINGRMQSEGWFDEEKTKQVDNKLVKRGIDPIHHRLLKNLPIEISTGLFTDNEPAPSGATWNGAPYEFIARRYVPDHIAVLPDQKGACSIADGCGVMVNSSGSRPIPKTLLERFMDWTSLMLNAGKYGNPQHAETGTFMEHGAGTGKGEVHDAAVKGRGGWYGEEHPETPPSPDEQYVPGNPKPPQQTHHETDLTNDEWDKMNETALKGGRARDALDDNYGGMASEMKGGGGSDIGTLSAHNQAPQGVPMGPPSQFNPAPLPPAHEASKQAAGASLMAEHAPAREPALAAVDSSKDGNSKKAASFHTKAAEAHEGAATDARKNKDPNTADQHDNAAALHRKAASLHQASMIGNMSGGGAPIEIQRNQFQEQETTMPNFGTVGYSRGQALRLLTANCKCDKDKAAYNSLSDDELKRLLGEIAKAPVGNARKGVTEEDDGEIGQSTDDEGKAHKKIEDEYDDQGVKIETKALKTNRAAVLNKWMNDPNVPPQVKEAAIENLRHVREQKIKLVTKLIANVKEPEQRQAVGNRLMKKELSELRELVSLIPTANDEYGDFDRFSEPVANYGLAAGGPGVYALTENESADVLPLTAEHTGGICRRPVRNKGKNEKDSAGHDVGGEADEDEPEKETA